MGCPTHIGILFAMESTSAMTPSGLTTKGQATRERIVTAAADLIFDHGVAAVSMLDVRRAAKASGSQLSHYFGDKQSLIRAVIAQQGEAVVQAHQMSELGQLDSFKALERWAQLNIQSLQQRDCQGGCSYGSLAGELAECDDSLRADLAAGFERWEQLSPTRSHADARPRRPPARRRPRTTHLRTDGSPPRRDAPRPDRARRRPTPSRPELSPGIPALLRALRVLASASDPNPVAGVR